MGTQQPGTVYLIHFQQPYKHARHYCGWVHSPSFLEPRLGAHRDGAGARLMAVSPPPASAGSWSARGPPTAPSSGA